MEEANQLNDWLFELQIKKFLKKAINKSLIEFELSRSDLC